ncbi:MAG: acyl-CoA dehydrogenase family protein [Pseudomonadota bacterium]
MNFDFSEEQIMLRDSVARFIQDDYDFDTRNKVVASDDGFSRENWQTFAELGWLSIPFTEENGGFGGSDVDTMLIMEQLGRGLVAEPYVATVLLFGGLIQAAGTQAQREALLAAVIGGELQGAFAYLEAKSRFDLSAIETLATAAGDGFTISGEKTVVFNGAAADKLIVSAQTEQGVGLFLVDATDAGVSRNAYRLMDGQVVANISFSNAAAERLGEAGDAMPHIQQVVDTVTLALCGEAVGIMGKLNEVTVEYTRTREQFGVAIGSFQALQHRMVDTFMSYEQVKSLLYRALCDRAEGKEDATRSLHALKTLVDRAGKHIGGESIQLHGGMGLTEEMAVGHYVRRLMMINTTFGNGDYHQQLFSALSYSADAAEAKPAPVAEAANAA